MGKRKLCVVSRLKNIKRYQPTDLDEEDNINDLSASFEEIDLNNNESIPLGHAAPINAVFEDRSTQTGFSTQNSSTQTDQKVGAKSSIEPKEIDLNKLANLTDCLRNSVNDWNHKSERTFSTFIYMILRHFSVSHAKIKALLKKFNCLNVETEHRWTLTLLEEDDQSIILLDKRGGNKKPQLYAEYPEIEMEAKAFAIAETSRKKFIVLHQKSFKVCERAFSRSERRNVGCQ
jgi:hypothetical protein